jgi:hypothetical protein
MLEPMTVRVEVWPVAADRIGLWLISGDDAWRSDAVMADGDVHFEVEMLLHEHGISDTDIAALHSTSWRPDGPAVVLTYMAVVKAEDVVLVRWPHARPVTAELTEAAGKPPTHAATEPPVPRYLDVLYHGLRHLHHLAIHDATNAAAMGKLWRDHLEPFEPALSGMYSDPHKVA